MLAAPAFAQSSAATVNALADAEPGAIRSGPRAPSLSLTARESLPGLAPRGSVDVGVQWSHPIGGQLVDFSAWRRVTPPPRDALSLIEQQESTVYGARVEMKLAPASKRLFADKFIGLQLDSGARIGLKKSNGNPTIYYRNQF
ncbi:hypothetical protein [Ramlibacter algicola]|uniref:Uncharacterized protein n=1 Tax=Ramlibacter algicola TaxID=2795217 RepID=A0A934URV2_9BURK|nr:hypothetical protein [Ramlibacter algicola]MBK0393580.1 hypothetical protein [Ramlibacter algicola]